MTPDYLYFFDARKLLGRLTYVSFFCCRRESFVVPKSGLFRRNQKISHSLYLNLSEVSELPSEYKYMMMYFAGQKNWFILPSIFRSILPSWQYVPSSVTFTSRTPKLAKILLWHIGEQYTSLVCQWRLRTCEKVTFISSFKCLSLSSEK